MNSKNIKIAGLACSYNRLTKTAAFLESLRRQLLPIGYIIDIFILDDNSSDGTSIFIKNNYPSVHLIIGTGSLFWAGSMRKVWDYAQKHSDYDLFLLLNDDIILEDNAIENLIRAHESLPDTGHIIVGTLKDPSLNKITYGGERLLNRFFSKSEKVVPDDVELKPCDLGNANVMLVDNKVFSKIKGFSDYCVHGIADYDYTLRAKKSGFNVWVAPGYYGICEFDHGNNWLPQTESLQNRIKYLYSHKGLAYKQYLKYILKHFPLYYPESLFKLWLKTLFPVLWDKYKL